ncbi:YoaK family protein [Paraburkholderia denitrificans]|uniref:YoaK family protein n=1 Tax=Paraburkholderia denitrificans TaxID=694025 RepID=A0ABW0JF15_9BURK
MLLRQGEARDHEIDRQLACILAGIAGALNTAAFHAAGFFSANMTGNVSSLSDHAALGQWWVSAFYFAIIVVFVFGSTTSTLLINAGCRRTIRSIYAITILAEAVLMVVLGLAEWSIPSMDRGPVLIIGLSFLMGFQNAVVTRISGARVRATHVSGMSTDIGIEFGMLLDIIRGREPDVELAPYSAKLRLHVQTVLSFLAGGVAGMVVYQAIGTRLLFAAAVLLFAMAITSIIRARTQSNPISIP